MHTAAVCTWMYGRVYIDRHSTCGLYAKFGLLRECKRELVCSGPLVLDWLRASSGYDCTYVYLRMKADLYVCEIKLCHNYRVFLNKTINS